MKVPDRLVSSTMTESSGIVFGLMGTLDIAMKPIETHAMAIRYQSLRDSV